MPSVMLPHPPLSLGPVTGTTLARRLLAGFVVVILPLVSLSLTSGSAQADSGDGTALGWGYNADGATVIPASLSGKDVIDISSMDGHSVALTSDGRVTAWGTNLAGQTDVPVSLADQTVTAVGAGCGHTLALTSDGHVTAWGSNDAGQTSVPASLDDKTVTAVSAGCAHNLALTSDGHITAWGGNGDGQATVPPSLVDKTVTDVDAGFGHSMAVTSDGGLTAWGGNGSGQTAVPASLTGKTVTSVAAGLLHSVALTSDGQVTAWGDNSLNQTRVPFLNGRTVIEIEASVWHSLALTSDGNVLAWGHNGQCQLCVPGLPPGTGYTAISVGHLHSVGVRAPLPLDFTTGTTATITGKPQVGQTLTADAGDVAPAPTSYTYHWYADGSLIPGASGPTYVLTAAEQGDRITVEVSAVKHGYNTSTDTSAPTERVVGVTVVGTTTVGRTLTGDSSAVTPDPPATLAKQWLRDGAPIPAADSGSYVLTNADAGSIITFRVTATEADVTDAAVTSAAVGPVSGGVIMLPAPTITGNPVVDGTLSAALPASLLDPADADVTWQWFRGETRVGTGSVYTPNADDVAAVLTVRVTATKDYFHHVSRSADSAQVAQATFGTAPIATIAGTVKVGQVLTAGTGTIAPDPDDLAYQWYADASPVTDATDATFTLTSAQKHRAITLAVTATRAGYQDASDLSAPTPNVATDLAPDLQLDASDRSLRRGQATTLTWASAEADAVTASGAWAGTRATSGSMSVSPTELGTVSYVLEARNDNGTTTSQVTLEVTRPAKALVVTAPSGLHLTGAGILIGTRGLEPREPYTVRIGGIRVATGNTGSTGLLTRRVTVPSRTSDGIATVTVTGSASDRTGGTRTRVVTNKALGIRVAKQYVRMHHRQWVMVSGLARHEMVTVRFRGRRVSSSQSRADALGHYRVGFRVGRHSGTHAITATGQFAGRTATTTFWVRRR